MNGAEYGGRTMFTESRSSKNLSNTKQCLLNIHHRQQGYRGIRERRSGQMTVLKLPINTRKI